MKKQFGLSLVELMIAMAIGLVVSGAVMVLFLTNIKTNQTQDNMARLQENARFALIKMQTDIRQAGYRGCLGRKGAAPSSATTSVNNVITGFGYKDNLAMPVEGFYGEAAWTPALDASISAVAPTPTVGSDVITVRMGVGTGVPLTAVMANGSANISIAANTDGLAVGDTALIADCVASTVFSVTTIAATSISHAVGSNATADLGRAFGTDAVVMPISTITYYVGASSDLTGGLSLWRKTNGNASEELADNVEKLKILYGEDTNGDLSPDKYVTANNVTDMNDVVAVKLMLLTRTSDDNLSANGQSYTFNGAPAITPTDKRIRRTFTLVTTIRNRAA
ncbi:MAG: PilW family protein [Betaproteobacteria bacterium]